MADHPQDETPPDPMGRFGDTSMRGVKIINPDGTVIDLGELEDRILRGEHIEPPPDEGEEGGT